MINKAKTIIYAHGIGNKTTEDMLECQWDRALFGFELGERSRLACWVNRSKELPLMKAALLDRGRLRHGRHRHRLIRDGSVTVIVMP